MGTQKLKRFTYRHQCSLFTAIARSGGFLGRKSDGLPGWQTLPGFLTTSLKACACAGEQGKVLVQVLSPLPLCPSAPLLLLRLKLVRNAGLWRGWLRLQDMCWAADLITQSL
jgi:hypothetical protein